MGRLPTGSTQAAIGTRITKGSHKWFADAFPNVNAGVKHVLEATPELFHRAAVHISGHFTRDELLTIETMISDCGGMIPKLSGSQISAVLRQQKEYYTHDPETGVDLAQLLGKVEKLHYFEQFVLEMWGYTMSKQKDSPQYQRMLTEMAKD